MSPARVLFVTPPVRLTCAQGRRSIPFRGVCCLPFLFKPATLSDTDCIVSMIPPGRAFSSLHGDDEDGGDGASGSRKDPAHVEKGGANSTSQEESLQSSVEQIGSRRRLKGAWK